MVDNVSREKRKEIMSKIKSKDSKIEIKFRKEIWRAGFRYRKNAERYFGKPDLILKRYKTVIFIDSCFWHGCNYHCRIPSTNTAYWVSKIAKNKKRDKAVTKYYKINGWKVIRIWEHDLTRNFDATVKKAMSTLKTQDNFMR